MEFYYGILQGIAMGSVKKVMIWWVVGLAVASISLAVFPHFEEWTTSSLASLALQLLLFLLSISIVRKEPTRKNRLIFLNFALFFSTSVLFHLYNFLGKGLFPDVTLIRLYFTQYVSLGGYFLLLAFAVVYLTIDLLFREHKALPKYIVTLILVAGPFGYYYAPFFADARHMYQTENALDWRQLSAKFSELKDNQGEAPTPRELADNVEMSLWKDGVAVGTLHKEEKERRVSELYPYLLGSSYVILLLEPLYKNVLFMNVICVLFILLFFGYQYKKDPPQGAYIEKIMFLLFLFCGLEILHAWSFIKSLEWQTFYEMTSIGQYVSAAILGFMALFFALRLKFITSISGEFYEQELVTSPTAVTRWRDWLDELVIAHFLDKKALRGRMLARSNETE